MNTDTLLLIASGLAVGALTLAWSMVRAGKLDEIPECFDSYPTPQHQAEYDCHTCPFYRCCSR